MAEQNGKPSMLDYAAKIGPAFGGIAGLCYAAAYILLFIRDHDLSEAAQVFFGFGFASAAYGIGKAVKKSTDINVAAQAENRIQDPHRVNESVVPQIQAEIDKQQSEKYRTTKP